MEDTTETAAAEVETRLGDVLGIDDDPEEIGEDEEVEGAPEGEDDERTEDDDSEEPEEGDSEDDEATDSVEVDGKIIDLPPGTPAEVVEQVQAAIAEKERALKADYTRKTQEAAEMRKFVEAKHTEVQQREQFNQTHIKEIAELHALHNQLQEYEGVDWNALADSDPVAFMKHQHQRAELREAVGQMQHALNGQLYEMQAQEKAQAAEVYNFTVQTLHDKIPNYGPEVDQKLVATAKAMGERYGIPVSVEKLQKMHDPLVWLGLHEVARLQELMSKGAKDKRVPPPATKFVKPGIKTNKTTESERQARENLRKTGRGAAALIAKFI